MLRVVWEEVGEGVSEVFNRGGCGELGGEDFAALADAVMSNGASGKISSFSLSKGASRRLFCEEEAVIDVSCSSRAAPKI